MGASGGYDASLDGASQGGGGIRKEQMGLRNEYRAWMPLKRGLSWFAKFSQGEFGVAKFS